MVFTKIILINHTKVITHQKSLFKHSILLLHIYIHKSKKFNISAFKSHNSPKIFFFSKHLLLLILHANPARFLRNHCDPLPLFYIWYTKPIWDVKKPISRYSIRKQRFRCKCQDKKFRACCRSLNFKYFFRIIIKKNLLAFERY